MRFMDDFISRSDEPLTVDEELIATSGCCNLYEYIPSDSIKR